MRTTIVVFLLPLTLVPLALATTPAAAAETVAVPAFRSVQLRGGGEVVVRQGAAQRVTITSGSTQFTGFGVDRNGQLEIDACNARCPQRYDLRIEIVSPSAPDAAISGGGLIRFDSGFSPAADLAMAVNGGGQIDARAISVGNISAAVNGGGRVLAGRSASLSAAVSGGGEIRYAGSPRVSSVVNGGGVVHKGN